MKYNPKAEAFLRALGGSTFVFQTFTDSKEKKAAFKNKLYDPLARSFVGTYAEHKDRLDFYSSQGAGVFVQVQDGIKRGNSNITGIKALFVDLDDPETSKESIESIKQTMPKPSIITNSSEGKFHIYWRVSDCPLDMFKKMQQQLYITFNADKSMVNLDRVMRLPGYPHNKDLANPFPVSSVAFNTMYTVEELYKAASKAPILTTIGNGIATRGVTSDPLGKDVFGLDIGSEYEVPSDVPEGGRNFALIQYVGFLIGTGTRDEQVAKEMVRKQNNNFSDPISEGELQATVFQSLSRYIATAIIEDEKKAKAALTNNMQVPSPSGVPAAPVGVPTPPPAQGVVPTAPVAPITSLPEQAAIDLMLEKYILSVEGQRVIDTHATGEYKVTTLSDFKAMMKNTGKKNNLANVWLEHVERKTCRDIMWFPCEKEFIVEDGYSFYNLYKKPLVEPVQKGLFDAKKIALFMNHLEWMFPNKVDREFFIDWLAKTITAPTVRIPWAPLLISDQGAGKGFIYQVIAQLVGADNADVVTMQSLESQFNPYLMKCSVLLIDEVSKPKNEGINDKLKAYISEERLKINRKGMQERTFPIYCNIIMFSNNDDAAHLQNGDRRYWVHRIEGVKPDMYYDSLFSFFKRETKTEKVIYTENLSHLLRFLIDRDLSKFNHNHKPPTTSSKNEMVQASRSQLDIDLQDAIESREGPFGADILPVSIIKEYMGFRRGEDIKANEEYRLSRMLNKYSKATMFKSAVLPVEGSEFSTTKYRARCIRNVDIWAAKDLDSIRYELTRSLQMHHNREVMPAKGEENV